jgi:hypothetical protein
MTIRLRIDPATGKKDIVVSLHSDADALPQEHEQLHRKLVDRLIEGGLLKAGEQGNLVVERESKEGAGVGPVGEAAPPERRAAAESG